MVPVRFSSANRRMVIMGIRNRAMVEANPSSGRMICSFTFIGCCWPIIWACKLKRTKSRVAV